MWQNDSLAQCPLGQKVIKINCVGFIFPSFPVCLDTRVTKPSKVGPERTHPRPYKLFSPSALMKFNIVFHFCKLAFGEDRTSLTLLWTAFQRALRVPLWALWKLDLSHQLSSVSTQECVRFLTAHIIEREKVQLVPIASYGAYFSSVCRSLLRSMSLNVSEWKDYSSHYSHHLITNSHQSFQCSFNILWVKVMIGVWLVSTNLWEMYHHLDQIGYWGMKT